MKRITQFLRAHRGQILLGLLATLAVIINPLGGVLFLGMAHSLPAKGREVQVLRGTSPGTLIPGCRTKSITINGEPVDLTTDDDSGWRVLDDAPGEVTVEITVEGVTDDETLMTEAVSTTDRVQYTRFTWPGGTAGRLDGNFYLSNFQMGAPYKDAFTFSATFLNTGAVAFTAAL